MTVDNAVHRENVVNVDGASSLPSIHSNAFSAKHWVASRQNNEFVRKVACAGCKRQRSRRDGSSCCRSADDFIRQMSPDRTPPRSAVAAAEAERAKSIQRQRCENSVRSHS